MKQLIEKFRNTSRKSLFRNIVWLYGVHFVNYLVPLITIPYLTRVLGLEGWGIFALIQSFAMYLMAIVEYNFTTSGSRDVSIAREDKTKRSELLASIIGAKILLSGVVAIAGFIALSTVSTLRDNPTAFWLGVFWSVTLGSNLLWYFQGLERMQVAAGLDVTAKLAATLGVFWLINSPSDIGLFFFINSIANLISIVVSLFLAYREVPFIRPTLKLAREALTSGGSLFFARLVYSAYYTANVFVVGLFSTPQMAGIYAGADKLSKGFAALPGPITVALFPRFSHLFHSDRAKAKKLFRKSSALLAVLGIFFGLVLFWVAPVYTKYYLGPGYEETVNVLKWLAFYPLCLAIANILVMQWMLPLGMDNEYRWITTTTAIVHIGLAWFFVSKHGAVGMGQAIIATEAFEIVLLNAILVIKRMHPWQSDPTVSREIPNVH